MMKKKPIVLWLLLGLLLGALAAEGFCWQIWRHRDIPFPPLFGNFPANRAYLEKQPPKESFSFAIVGDTKSVGTFDTLCREIGKEKLDFAVLLGDCTYGGTPEEHRYFRYESGRGEYLSGFPVFYVIGNHDVDPVTFPVSRFEKEYGGSHFQFEYNGCLFVVLTVIDDPAVNQLNREWLESLVASTDLSRYRYRFVFMHTPPDVADVLHGDAPEMPALMELFRRMKADYVMSGDYHGYFRTDERGTHYLVSGGGGARFKPTNLERKFIHSVMLTVNGNSVEEQMITSRETIDLEDVVCRSVLVFVGPWAASHLGWVLLLNLGLAVGLVAVLRALLARRRKPVAPAPAA